MSDNKQTISFSAIFAVLRRFWSFSISKWKQLLLVGFIGGLLGFFYAYSQKPIYKATLSFILAENEGGASINLSSLAGLAGLSGVNNGSSVNEDKLQFISQSRKILGSTLLSEVSLYNQKDKLINHFISVYKLQPGFKSDTTLKDFVGFTHSDLNELSYAENKVMDQVISKMSKSGMYFLDAKKKSGIVAQNAGILSINFSSIDEGFSKSFVEVLFKNLSEFYTHKATQRQLKNFELIKSRADSLQRLLFQKENYGANYFDRNLGMIRMQGRLELERAKRDVEMLGLMYAEVLKNQEIARFALENQTPVFQIIDQPTLPLEKKKMSKINTALAGAFALVLLALIYFIVKNISKIID